VQTHVDDDVKEYGFVRYFIADAEEAAVGLEVLWGVQKCILLTKIANNY